MDDVERGGNAEGVLESFFCGECYLDRRIGFLRRAGESWLYLRIQSGQGPDQSLLIMGNLEIRGFSGTLALPSLVQPILSRRLESIPQSLPRFPLTFYSLDAAWDRRRDEALPELRASDLEAEAFERIAADGEHEYYWHEDFDRDFYRAQAKAGCIAITIDRGDRPFLVSELHSGYAVLDWENLHRSRSLGRLFRSERYAALRPRLAINPDPRPILARLARRWRSTWLVAPYRKLVRQFAAEPIGELRFWGIELHAERGGEDRIAAGELGYTLGRTYTSLSGFYDRSDSEFSDMGKVQLHLLARHLEERGFAFWNLGEPTMKYKQDLGARILPRAEFLERWKKAAAEPDPGMGEPRAGDPGDTARG